MDILDTVELDEEAKSKLKEAFDKEFSVKLDESVKGLKSKNDELLAEKQKWLKERDEAQQKEEEARLLAQKQAEDKAKAENDYKQLFESQKQESENLKSQLQQFQENIKRQKVNSEANRLAMSLTKDVNKAKILEQQFSQRLQIVDGELRVVDDRGHLTVQTLNELTQTVKESYPFLVDGSQATGGSATRSQGRAEVSSKEITRTEFDGLSQPDRAKYLREGGKVINA
jgi:hypothetical protein